MTEVKSKRIGNDLTTGRVLPVLLIFVGPIILSNLIQQVYSVVDLIVIGQHMGKTGTVGVSTGGEMSDIVTPIAMAFGAAGQIYIGQLTGAGSREKIRTAVGTIFSMMMLMSIILAGGVLILRDPILHLLNCPDEAYDQAMNYLTLTTIGFPFIFGYNAVSGILRGMGDSGRPLIFVIIAAVVNIFLDILLVVPLHMEAAGTAIATTAAQAASFCAALYCMYRKRHFWEFDFRISGFRIDPGAARVILSLGIPQAARTMFVRFSMLYVNASVNAFGITASATNSVGNKIQKFLEVFSQSFSQASSAMVAQNLGAKRPERAKQTVRYSCGICVVISAVLAIPLLLLPKVVFGIFTADSAVLDMGVYYLRILIIHMFLSAVTSTYQAMVIGCGNALLNFAIGIMDGVVCKIGFSMLFTKVMRMGVFGYFWGTGISRLLPALIVIWYFYTERWKRRKLFI